MNTDKNKNLLVIINPNAGLLNARHKSGEAEWLVRRRLPGARVERTESEAHAEGLLREAVKAGAARVIAVGGDGTLHHAARTLLGSQTALGVVSLGSANNIARSLNIPLDLEKMILFAAEGPAQAIDVGKCNQSVFIEAAGIGFHASVLARYNRYDRKSLVRSIYAMTRTAIEMKSFQARLVVDGSAREQSVYQLTVNNMPFYGTNFRPAPHALPNDGLLDVTILPKSEPGLLPFFAAARAGLTRLIPGVVSFQCKTLQIETENPVPVHCDADARMNTPVEITVNPLALRIIAPLREIR